LWFGQDNVFLNPDHVPYLHQHFEVERFEERRGSVPWLPLAVPYYIFIGRRRA
jgi:S-adenosylmethionine-diacylgycerolhomoserine-N-methlytransferase